MNSLQSFLLTFLALCPTVILFGPILFRILKTKDFDVKKDAISTLRDIDSTKIGFLIWINLYMVSQLVYMLLALPFIVKLPLLIYVLGFGSLLFGIIAFFFLSTTLKHMTFGSLSAVCTGLSILGLGFLLYKLDFFLALISTLVGVTTFLVLVVIAFKRLRMWLAEYLALGALSIWNLIVLVKVFHLT